MSRVRILGSGPAALAAARVLTNHNLGVSLVLGSARPGPALLLNAVTVRLLQDLFGCQAALLAHGRMIRGRLVAWGEHDAEPALVEEPGLAIAAVELHQVLRHALRAGSDKGLVSIAEPEPERGAADAVWTVDARGKSTDGSVPILSVGERVALCSRASLQDTADPSLAVVEAVERGWLFLLPLGGRHAVLQAVAPRRPADAGRTFGELLDRSRLVARFVTAIEGSAIEWPSAPRFRPEPARSGWLAAGDAAVSYDPLCGDGTGQAVRCGLLAGAVLEAIERGEPQGPCLEHYRNRLGRALRAHLEATVELYERSRSQTAWWGEIAAARQVLIGRQLCGHGETTIAGPRYRLAGLSLVRTPF